MGPGLCPSTLRKEPSELCWAVTHRSRIKEPCQGEGPVVKIPTRAALLVPGCLFFSSVFSRCSVAVFVSLLQQTGVYRNTHSTAALKGHHRWRPGIARGAGEAGWGGSERAGPALLRDVGEPGPKDRFPEGQGRASQARAWPTSRSPGPAPCAPCETSGRQARRAPPSTCVQMSS